MAQLALIDAYQEFMVAAQGYVNIQNDTDYNAALTALEEALESASDALDDPLNPLIDMLSHAVEQYEARDVELTTFVSAAGDLPADLAVIRELMRQHHLSGSDLPEIGDKTMVSKILHGKRTLTRAAIERLSARFGIRPSAFFNEAS
jgi:HTH-type transcriptional regulator/antitoxin HigA